MVYRILADAVLVLHLGFVLFVVAGAALAARRPRLLPWHLAAAAWGVGIEAVGAVCPLTYLENRLRLHAGQSGYGAGFIEHYLVAAIYPAGLTRPVQVALGAGVLLLSAVLYAWLWRQRSKRCARPEPRAHHSI
jgi:hypothetical protein